MTICRVQHNKNYTVINNTITRDNRLSWKAKGIWLYAFSRQDDWHFNTADLINQSTDGKDAIYSGLKELEEFGYLVRDQPREKGKFQNADWIFHETPQIKEILPQRENTVAENPPLVSTEEFLLDKSNKNSKTNTPPYPQRGKPAKPALCDFGLFVKLSKEDYEELCKKHTKLSIDKIIEEMNLWIEAKGKSPYQRYKAAITQWMNRRNDNPQPKPKQSNLDKVKAKFKHGMKYNGAECFIGEEAIAFERGMTHYEVRFKTGGFDEQLENILRKFDIRV